MATGRLLGLVGGASSGLVGGIPSDSMSYPRSRNSWVEAETIKSHPTLCFSTPRACMYRPLTSNDKINVPC